jgi:hypothetical protein
MALAETRIRSGRFCIRVMPGAHWSTIPVSVTVKLPMHPW